MKSIRRYLTFLVLVTASMASATTSADDWMEVTGGSTVGIESRAAGANRLHIQLGLRALHATDDNTLYSLALGSGANYLAGASPADSFTEVSVGYGRRAAFKYATTSFQIGAGLTKYDSPGSDNIKLFIPLRASFIVGRKVGFTGSLIYHLEEDNQFFGMEFGCALGNFN